MITSDMSSLRSSFNTYTQELEIWNGSSDPHWVIKTGADGKFRLYEIMMEEHLHKTFDTINEALEVALTWT